MSRGRGAMRVRRGIARVLAMALAALVALALGEIGLRLFRPQHNPFRNLAIFAPDPVLGFVPAPSALPVGGFAINSFGMRGPEPARTRDPETLRVGFLGDSFVFGVGRYEDTFAVRTAVSFEKRTGRPLEPVNAAVPGYGLAHYVHRIASLDPLDPDVIVLGLELTTDLNATLEPLPRVVDGAILGPGDALPERGMRERLREGSHLVRWIENLRRMVEQRRVERQRALAICPTMDRVGERKVVASLARARAAGREGLARALYVAMASDFPPDTRSRLFRTLASFEDTARPLPEAGELCREVAALQDELRRERPAEADAFVGWTQSFLEDVVGPDREHVDPIYARAAEELDAVVAHARARGVPLLVVAIPARIQVDAPLRARNLAWLGLEDRYDWERPQRWLAGMAKERGFELLSLEGPFRDVIAAGREPFLRFDGHWNAFGQDLAGRLVARRLADMLAAPPIAQPPKASS